VWAGGIAAPSLAAGRTHANSAAIAVLQTDVARLQAGQEELKAGQAALQAGLAEVQAGQGELRAILLEQRRR